MSSTAMEQRRKQWLLEQRLTAPLAEASEQGGNSFHGLEEQLPSEPGAGQQPAAKKPRKDGFGQFGGNEQGAAEEAGTALGSLDMAAGAVQRQIAEQLSRNKELQEQVAALEGKLAKTQELLKSSGQQAERLARQSEDWQRTHAEREKQQHDAIVQLARAAAEQDHNDRRQRIALDASRLGAFAVQRVGAVLQEIWEDGPAFRDITERQRELQRLREGIENERKLLKRRLAPPAVDAGPEFMQQDAYLLADECLKVRVVSLKKEDDQLQKDKDRLDQEKTRHHRELKRVRDEDCSRFKDHVVLGGRYVLHSLLGRGGFSEVYKAYDVRDLRYVACKIHQLVPQWSEDRKRNYVKHAAREYSILKRMAHNNIVRLFDVFEIDSDSFCTVLELCEGHDLDIHLKMHASLPEREARVVIAQVFAGLAYLSSGDRRVIHYDLKPANILFDVYGRVKITDFGLSKIMDDSVGASGIELTSQGAGTYWYLPPECFEPGVPKISSKVDVWSVGVIFFQMLYGKRPFGHDQTQERILREETIIRASHTIDFPDKPAVSSEAKAFIRRCLTYDQSDRPDVLEAASDQYLSYKKQQDGASAKT